MAFSDQLAAIKTHAVAAGTAMSNPIKDVAIAWPAPGPERCIRIFYGGEAEPPRIGAPRVLNEELVAERIVLVAFWPMSNLSVKQAEVIEDELYDLKHEIRTRVLGDSQLGGQSTDLEMGYAETDFVLVGGTSYRTLEIEFLTDHTAYTLAA